MNNVLLDELPTEWNGYRINTGFDIGIQLMQAQYDKSLTEYEKADIFLWLMFGEDDRLREHPQGDDFIECFKWFINGWFHDHPDPDAQNSRERVVDYDVDQWRIYADFRQIYGIDLCVTDMHWWMFCGLLWNMPYRKSSFLQVVQTRQERPRTGASAEERRNLIRRKKMYELDQLEEKKEYTEEEKNAIDDFDRMMAEKRGKKKVN